MAFQTSEAIAKFTLAAICAIGLLSSQKVSATLQETVTFNNVNSDDNGTTQGDFRQPGGPGNGVVSTSFTGSYVAGKIHINGVLHDNGVGSYALEAAWYVQPPTGPGILMQGLTTVQDNFSDLTITDTVFNLPPGGVTASGTWTFRAWETYDDNGIDAKWNSVTFTLDDAMPATIQNAGGGSPGWTESEGAAGNSSTFSYNYINGMAVNDTITGTTTGTTVSQTSGAAGTADYFRIKLAGTSPGIYRNQLTLTTTTTGHSTTLIGHSQVADSNTGGDYTGYINGTAEVTAQPSLTSGSTRISQFYSFGAGEVLYKVTGAAATSANYVSTLTRTTITPIAITGTLGEGNVTITRAAGNTNTIDMVLLNSNYQPIANRHGSSTVALARTLGQGTYYLGVSNANTTNDRNSPADSTSRTNNVLDFPDAVANSSTTTLTNLNMTVTTGAGSASSSGGVKAAAFDVAWYSFTLAPLPTNPSVSLVLSPTNGLSGLSLTATATVTAGLNPTSSGLAVSLDALMIDAGTVTLYDDGPGGGHGDAVLGDNVFTNNSITVGAGATQGDKTLTATVTDAQSRSGMGSAAFRVGYCAASSGTNDEFISHVTVAMLDHATAAYPTGGYSDLSGLSTNMSPGGSYPITVANGPPNYSADQCTVWVDWNQNGSFTDPGEQIAAMSGSPGNGPYTGTVAVPFDATPGPTRMRVRINWNAAPPACGGTTYGSTEDYTIVVSTEAPPFVSNQSASPFSVLVGSTTQLVATVSPGLPASPISTVTVNLASIGGSSAEPMFDDGNHGDGGNADGVWGVLATVGAATTEGDKTLQVTAIDNMSRNGTANIAMRVNLLIGSCCVDSSCTQTTQADCGGTWAVGGCPSPVNEGFENINTLPGWTKVNRSSPLGTTGWSQGDAVNVFPSQAGTGNSYITANYNNTGSVGTISNWLIMPTMRLENGVTLDFYTRCPESTFPDRMQVRMSLSGSSSYVGSSETSVGDFDTLLLDINPTLTAHGYPESWAAGHYTLVLSGIASPTSGRLAFRYFVTNAGLNGSNSDLIGIDSVAISGSSEPCNAEVTGACCVPNTGCQQLTQTACLGQSGDWQSGVPCTDTDGDGLADACDCQTCNGDMEGNGVIDGRAIPKFVQCYLGGNPAATGCACADINNDGAVDDTDVGLLVSKLLAVETCP